MAEPVTIPISIFELTVHYEKCAIRFLREQDRAELIQAMFDALTELNADDFEVITAGKTTEQGIRLRLASQGITFFFGIANCKFTKEAAAWPDADKILGVLDTFLKILMKVGGVSLGKRNSVLSLHLQLKTGSFKDILRPFIDSRIKQMDPAPLDAMAIIARWPKSRITLDGSAQLANGIYVQMEREFASTSSYDEMRQQIFKDEVDMLKLLGVEAVDV